MKRPWVAGMAALAIAVGAWAYSGEVPAVTAPPPTIGDCEIIGLWNNGFHTSLSMRAELFAPDHPLRRLYPQARYLLIGWGDLAFYRSRGDDVGLGLLALVPGGESGLHVHADNAVPVETWYYAKEVMPLALSRAGVRDLIAYITDSMAVTPDGGADVVAFEQRGYFLRGRKSFHALNVCNHWTNRALRRAGVPLNAAYSFTGDILIERLRGRWPGRCG